MKRRTVKARKLRDRRTGGKGIKHSPYARHNKAPYNYSGLYARHPEIKPRGTSWT